MDDHPAGSTGELSVIDRSMHRALAARVLRIDEWRWSGILSRYHSRTSPDAPLDERLSVLSDEVAVDFPDARALQDGPVLRSSCPACGAFALRERFRRTFDDARGRQDGYTYGACSACGHGLLLAGTSDPSVYSSRAYYESQSNGGVGYPAYAEEREYRELKGARLVRWALDRAPSGASTILEIGSGFGFTRRAAESLGLRSFGVDLNPAAADGAHRLYGMPTFTGTLGEAFENGAVEEGSADVVLYDFVLEHLQDPVSELRRAARALSARGVLVLRVPSMEALELRPFGALYRSFRNDHLHLFSQPSMDRMLASSGLSVTAYETGCGAHLLRECLTEAETLDSYARQRGPDLTVCTTRSDHAHSSRHQH